MVKLVNVYPNRPIVGTNPPIRSRLNAVTLTVEDIRKCLIANAYVEEILNGKKLIQLTFENYDKDNEVVEVAPVEEVPVEVAPVEEVPVEETPVEDNKDSNMEEKVVNKTPTKPVRVNRNNK